MDAEHVRLLGESDPVDLGARIRAARVAKGLTQGDLAGGEVSVGYVSRIEGGQRRPNAAVLEKFAAMLDTSPTQLLLGITKSEYDELRLGLDYAELALETGQATEAEARTAEVVVKAGAAGMEDLRSRARFLHGRSLEALGRLDDAIIELEDLAADLADGVLRISVGIALSRCYRDSGDFARAIETAEAMLRTLDGTPLDSTDEAVKLAVTLAAAHFERGDTGQAVRVCRRALTKAEKLDSPGARAAAYWNASIMEAERGSVKDAVELAQRALALLKEGESGRNLGYLQVELGILQLRLDPPAVEDARESLRQASENFSWANASTADVALKDVQVARAHLLAGEPEEARALTAKVLGAIGDSLPLVGAEALSIEGQSWMVVGDTTAATRAYRSAVAMLTAVGSDRGAAQLWFELASMLRATGDYETAMQAYCSAAASTGLRAATTAPARTLDAARAT